MAIIVEDGSGVVDAVSYVDVAYADAYFASKNWADWAGFSQEQKEGFLVTASAFADAKFGSKFKGRPLNLEQGLEFPRANAYDRYSRPITGVPNKFMIAVCEYAQQASAGSLYTETIVDTTIKSETTKVGPVTTSTTYVDGRTQSPYKTFVYADNLMKPYLAGAGSGQRRVIRG